MENEKEKELPLWQQVQNNMREKLCCFEFQKKDGSVRMALGTLCRGYFPTDFKTDQPRDIPHLVTYFDTVKCEWRCFRKNSVIKIHY